jgi:alpha-galactosidase
MNQRRLFPTVVSIALAVLGGKASAEAPKPSEFAACRQWYENVFGLAVRTEPASYMEIAYEDVGEAVSRGQSWRGTPYKLGTRTYTHGIAFNATKHIRVHLAKPAERFLADLGLENNDDTERGAVQGKGSVTFHILIGNTEVFRSPVMRLKDDPLPINLPLTGATDLELRVGDAGDGRDYDQALWAAATVQLSDGATVRLQDLPFAESLGDPFGLSFLYDGQSSRSFLGRWERKVVDRPPEPATTAGSSGRGQPWRREITYGDPQTRLEARVDVTLFSDFPAVEWVVYLKNTGAADTPILESIQALDTALVLAGDRSPIVYWANGAIPTIEGFAPRETVLEGQDAKLEVTPGGGKSSSKVMPYFNLTRGDAGVIAAIGWTGEWAASFAGTEDGSVTCRIGQARTHLRLHPGEEIRTPRVALVFYEGERWDGQNVWRRFVLAHHRPTPGGQKNWIAPITCINWGATSAAVHLDNIRQLDEHQLPIEYYWIDAEWYGQGHWWGQVGNWEAKKDLYPQGFRPLADRLNETGRKLLLWFEPERVCQGTPWWNEHPEWLLRGNGGEAVFNLGDPNARKFVTDFISERITDWKIGCYRQDFNGEPPLSFWNSADTPDRIGMTEIRYVEGLYAFWDELLARHPGLIIDNCAGGGTRLDLEMLHRGTPFWRCDGPHDPLTDQCYTWALLSWVPLVGTSQNEKGNDYEFRSNMSSTLGLRWWGQGDAPAEPIPADFPWDWAKRTLKQYQDIRKFYYGDYYPLTNYSQAADVWLAYQLDLPESNEGLVVVLKRPQSPYQRGRLRLHALSADARYEIVDLDRGERRAVPGGALCNAGLEVNLEPAPASALLTYRRER